MASVNYKNFSDKELKDQGNKQFAARNFDGAIDSYTLAIMKNSNVPHYYTNRALCYLNQKRWPQAVQDARQALEKDPNLVKGHFYLGKIKRLKTMSGIGGHFKDFSVYILLLYLLQLKFR